MPELLRARPYRDRNDLDAMLRLLMEARAQTNDWRFVHVGEVAWQFFMVESHLNPKDFIRLWYAGEKLVGYAVLGEDPSFDVQVRPASAWQGIEEEALAWAEGILADLRRGDPARWPDRCTAGARKDDFERAAFLARHGFQPGGEFSEVNLLRSLDGLPSLEVPVGFTVREVEPGEAGPRAALQHEVWQPWSVGNVSGKDYLRLMAYPVYRRDLDIVAVAPDGTPAAYVNGWIDPVNRIGDLGPVGALPACQRQGLARAILAECMRRMEGLGMDRVEVSTGLANTPARRLYQSLGFREANEYAEYVKTA